MYFWDTLRLLLKCNSGFWSNLSLTHSWWSVWCQTPAGPALPAAPPPAGPAASYLPSGLPGRPNRRCAGGTCRTSPCSNIPVYTRTDSRCWRSRTSSPPDSVHKLRTSDISQCSSTARWRSPMDTARTCSSASTCSAHGGTCPADSGHTPRARRWSGRCPRRCETQRRPQGPPEPRTESAAGPGGGRATSGKKEETGEGDKEGGGVSKKEERRGNTGKQQGRARSWRRSWSRWVWALNPSAPERLQLHFSHFILLKSTQQSSRTRRMFPSSPKKKKTNKKKNNLKSLRTWKRSDNLSCFRDTRLSAERRPGVSPSLPPSPPTIISLLCLQLQRSVRRMVRSAPPLLYLLSTPPLFISIEQEAWMPLTHVCGIWGVILLIVMLNYFQKNTWGGWDMSS